MVRAMLADRFRLALHIERREVTGYALVRRADGRLGSGITTPAFDCDAYRAAKARGETPREDPARKPYGDRLSCVAIVMPVIDHVRLIPGADSRLTAGSATIATVAGLLARQLGVPVEDRTGLTGVFDVELQFSNLPPRIDVENGPPLRSAVSEQLGLRLDEQKVTVDVLVIDRVEQPTPN